MSYVEKNKILALKTLSYINHMLERSGLNNLYFYLKLLYTYCSETLIVLAKMFLVHHFKRVVLFLYFKSSEDNLKDNYY